MDQQSDRQDQEVGAAIEGEGVVHRDVTESEDSTLDTSRTASLWEKPWLGALEPIGLMSLGVYASWFFTTQRDFWVSALFWSVCALVTYVAWLRRYVVEAAEYERIEGQARLADELKRGVEDQRDLTERMIEQARTQPKADFIIRHREAYQECYATVRDIRAATVFDLGNMEDSIRSVLHRIADMAAYSHPASDNHECAANVMLAISVEELESKNVVDKVSKESEAFLAANQTLTGMKHVLRVMTKLSCDLRTDSMDPKLDLRPISLPIPETPSLDREDGVDENDVHWFVLPGAPRAWVRRSPDQMPDITLIRNWCEKNASLQPDLVDRLERYMKQAARDQRFRAFVSLPLPDPREITEEGALLGVINIESREAGLFQERRPVEEFAALMEPLVYLLGELMAKLLEHVPDYALRDLLNARPA